MPTPSDSSPAPQAVVTDEQTSTVDHLLARAVLCRALKLGFDQPGEELHRTFFSPDGQETLRQAIALLEGGVHDELSKSLARIGSRQSPGPDHLQHSYDRLFGHTLRGKICPYECEYGKPGVFRQAQELADLGGFYSAFGLQSRETKHQRHDHIACELEFLQFLAHKELWAIDNGDSEMQEVSREASRKFLRDHLARFGPAFAASLTLVDPEGFHGELGWLLDAFLTTECRHLGVTTGPHNLELRPEEPDPAPMACGSDDPLVQIGESHDG